MVFVVIVCTLVDERVVIAEVDHILFLGSYLSQSKLSQFVKSAQSALSDLKRPPERLQSQCNYRPFIT